MCHRTLAGPAPSSTALSSAAGSRSANAAAAWRTWKGDATNVCAMTTAIGVNGKLRPIASSQGPAMPLRPKATSRPIPAAAGGKTAGIETKARRSSLPQKWPRARTMARGVPKRQMATRLTKLVLRLTTTACQVSLDPSASWSEPPAPRWTKATTGKRTSTKSGEANTTQPQPAVSPTE